MSTTAYDTQLAEQLEAKLTQRFGVLMTNVDLCKTLGYPSSQAFSQALARKTVPIPIFGIENRRGKFALTKDVAIWLAVQRAGAFLPWKDAEATNQNTNLNGEGT